MKKAPIKASEERKRAVVDTVRTILESKGQEAVTIAPNDTVYQAVAEMARAEVGALMVVAKGELVGIISERDYARKVILQGRSSVETLVQEIMTASPITVTLSHTVDECLRIIDEKSIRHLPVVDGGELKGIVTVRDLIKAIVSAQAYTIEQLRTYIATEYPS
jgi:CBS domain-containing protein